MNKLDKHQLVIFGIAMAIVTGFGLFQYYPLARSAYTIRKTMEQQQVVSDETDQLIQQMAQLRRQVESLQPVISAFETKIPRTRQFASLWQQITDLMNQHQLSEQVVQRESETDDSRFGSVRIRIKCGGTYRQIFDFFRSLQAQERLLRIESLQITNEIDYSGRIKMDALAVVFFQVAGSDSL